uniref:Uncharacterized protein n=1 Tax=Xenopus tropicalis TaxID=8364 RepID=A0A1B8XZ66_XENTR
MNPRMDEASSWGAITPLQFICADGILWLFLVWAYFRNSDELTLPVFLFLFLVKMGGVLVSCWGLFPNSSPGIAPEPFWVISVEQGEQKATDRYRPSCHVKLLEPLSYQQQFLPYSIWGACWYRLGARRLKSEICVFITFCSK